MRRPPSSSPTSIRSVPRATHTRASRGRRAGTGSASSKGMPSCVRSRASSSRAGASASSSTVHTAAAAGRGETPASFSSLQRSASVN